MSSFEEQARHTALQGPGIKTNKDLQIEIMQLDAFHRGETDINYLENRLGL